MPDYVKLHDRHDRGVYTPRCKPCRDAELGKPYKTCGDCKEKKPKSEFYNNNNGGVERLHSYCIACAKAKARKRNEEKPQEIRAQRWGKRLELLAAYGGACACCGDDTPEFLAVDHINNDGAAHRKAIGAADLTIWLRKNGYPQKGLQLLCHNCNMSKQFYGQGSCTHERVNLIDMLRSLDVNAA